MTESTSRTAIQWLALTVLFAWFLTGCQTGTGAGGSDATTSTSTSEMDSTAAGNMATAEEEARVRAEMEAVSAQAEYEQALDLLRERDFRGAETALLRTLDLDPTHAEAQERLREVRRILGVDPAGARGAFDFYADRERVKQQQIAIEVQARINRGLSAYDAGNYEDAEEQFESALEIIRFQPYYHDHKGLREQATDMLERSRVAKREASLRREEAVQLEAQRMRVEEEQSRERRSAERIRNLFEAANKQYRRGNYSMAQQIFQEILRLDPNNADARKLYETAREAGYAKRRGESLREHTEQWRLTMEAQRRAEIYQSDILVWPNEEEWLRVAQRQPRRGGSIEEVVSPEDQAVYSRLSTRVDIDFVDTPLEQVRSFLSEVSGVNMIIDQSVWEELGDEIPVTITLEDMALEQALDIILELQELAYRVENGVLIISTPSEAAGDLVLSLYDVRDLTGPVEDFPGPNIEIASDEDEGSFGISIADDEPTQTIGEDELVDLITENVFVESWDEDGRSIEPRNKTLIVRQTPEVHREIEKLLSNLRQSGGIMVTVESRFLEVQDNFLESLGIDWRGLGDPQIGPDETPTGTTLANLDDLLVGIPNAPSPYQTTGQDATSGLFYDDGQDGDLRARVENLFDEALGDSRVLTGSGGLTLQYAILDDAELEFIVRAVKKNERVTMLTAPSVTAFNTQRAHVMVVNQIAYIRDFDVEVAQAAAIADPIIGTIQDGLVLDVRPIVSSDRRFVTMELRPTIAELLRPIEVFQTTLATGGLGSVVQIQIPELTLEKVRTTVTVPDGGTIMIGGLKTSRSTSRVSTIPFLRNVPGGTFAFGNRGESTFRTSLVVLIKATITSLQDQEPQLRLNQAY